MVIINSLKRKEEPAVQLFQKAQGKILSNKQNRLWMKSYGVTIQLKATEQYFSVVLFIMLYKVVPTFESVDEILWCYHSNESY